MIKRIFASLLTALYLAGAFATFVTVAGCNTIEGAGKDIEKGGAKIKEEAREQKRY